MKISPISYTGRKEIANYAKKYAPLTKDEEKLKAHADSFADIDIFYLAKGPTCSYADKRIGEDLIYALQPFRYQPSSFAYKVAIDAIDSEASSVAIDKKELKETAREIAASAPDITKEDIYKDWDKLQ